MGGGRRGGGAQEVEKEGWAKARSTLSEVRHTNAERRAHAAGITGWWARRAKRGFAHPTFLHFSLEHFIGGANALHDSLTEELDRCERAEKDNRDPTHADRQVATQDIDLVLKSRDLLPQLLPQFQQILPGRYM
jgi:hypothetical protein